MPFNQGAVQKSTNYRNFYFSTDYSVYCLVDYSSISVRLISSFALRGPLFTFFPTENDRQTAFVPDRRN